MKRFIIIILSLLSIATAWSQSDDSNYRQMRDDGLQLMSQGKYSAALRLFSGAEGFASNRKQEKEIVQLQRRLQDSVHLVYNRAIENAKRYEKSNSYLTTAINDLNKLIPTEGLSVDDVYSWLGFCYEHLNQPNTAIEQYRKGVELNESYSAMHLADLLLKNNNVSVDSIARLYEMAASQNKEAYDRLGDLHRASNPQIAKDYYKKSGTDYGNAMLVQIHRHEKSATNASSNVAENTSSQYQSNVARSYPSSHSVSTWSFSDIWEIEDDIRGWSYDYSPHFPIAVSYSRTMSHFLIGGEIGFTCSKKKYEFGTNETLQPVVYFLATPGFYCKYFSIQGGVGALIDKKIRQWTTEIQKNDSSTVNVTGDGTIDVNVDKLDQEFQLDIEKTKPKCNFILKPSFTGYIPVSDGKYLTINAGYVFVPKFKELNGFSCGIGFRWTIN